MLSCAFQASSESNLTEEEEDKELTLFIPPLALSFIFLTTPFVSMTYAINNIYCHG